MGIRKASKDFLFFLEHYVYTLDEHDKLNPIKKMPKKPYLKELAQHFVNERLLLVEKSRQMMVTWLACSYSLWVAMFNEGKRVFIQSKKEKDANSILDRIKFTYERLPDLMKLTYPAQSAYCKISWPKQNSIIEAIPQGPEQVRQYTASLIISDEMAFQEQAEEAFIAAKPSLTGGGQYIGISTPNFKNFFYLLAKDKV